MSLVYIKPENWFLMCYEERMCIIESIVNKELDIKILNKISPDLILLDSFPDNYKEIQLKYYNDTKLKYLNFLEKLKQFKHDIIIMNDDKLFSSESFKSFVENNSEHKDYFMEMINNRKNVEVISLLNDIIFYIKSLVEVF